MNLKLSQGDADAQRELTSILLEDGIRRYADEFRNTPFPNKVFPYRIIQEMQRRYALITGSVMDWMSKEDSEIVNRLGERGYI